MFKHKVTYKDFNDQQRTEDLYFHLTLPELTRLEAEINKPLKEHIEELVANNNLNELLQFLEKIILNSYGVKSIDGKTFSKAKEVRDAFEYSKAYAEVFEQILTDNDLAKRFAENLSDRKAAPNTPVSVNQELPKTE